MEIIKLLPIKYQTVVFNGPVVAVLLPPLKITYQLIRSVIKIAFNYYRYTYCSIH